MKITKLFAIMIVLGIGSFLAVPGVWAQGQCVPFGGTIYAWHNEPAVVRNWQLHHW